LAFSNGLIKYKSTQTARELYDRMLELYPNRVNPGSLWGSANAAKAS
jgi:hypothetical protein